MGTFEKRKTEWQSKDIVQPEDANRWETGIADAHEVLDEHRENTTAHITQAERTSWNNRAMSSHTHNASDINSGTLAIGRIPTGLTNTTVSLGNHTHPPQTTITGNAATATALQTARQINGTSFNGSANITTANWGTARNITIGNHTVTAFNGSGNLSMTLAQVGASPVTHSHTIAQVTGLQAHLDDNIKHTTRLNQNAFTAVVDINQYPAGRSSFSVANMPVGHGWPANTGTVETEWINLVRITQVFTDSAYVNPTRWYRIGHQQSPNRWSDWQQLVNQRALPQPATTLPLSTTMATGVIGSSMQFARADHIHPAGTAIRFQTARMINGTSFNGTEGITTAHWGTARTITLAGAVTGSASINGSQNVTINTITPSALKYKLNITRLDPSELADKILDLKLSKWFDKEATESYANYLTARHQGEDIDLETETIPHLREHYGLIAEDLEEVGLGMYIQRGQDGREIEGIYYDRLLTLLIPLVREQKEKIERLEGAVEMLLGKGNSEGEKILAADKKYTAQKDEYKE